MEATKNIIKMFDDDFQGLDYKKSDLKKDVSFLRVSQNIEDGETDGLNSRGGSQAIAPPGMSLGCYAHSYLDRVSGETVEELLGFGGHLFRLASRDIVLTGTNSFIHEYNTTDDTYRIKAVDNSNNTLYTKDYQTSPYAAGADIYTLLTGLTGAGVAYTADIKNTIVVDGNQSLAAGLPTIACSYVDVDVGTFISIYNHSYQTTFWYHIVAKTANSITVISSFTLELKDDQVAGVGAGFISSIPYTGSGASGQTWPYFYWEGVAWGGWAFDNPDGFFSMLLTGYDVFNPNLFRGVRPVSLNSKCYFTIPTANDTTYGSTTISSIPFASYGKPFVYDGQNIYRLGVPSHEDYTTTPTIAPSVASGRWRYIMTLVQLDNQDIEWESNPSAEFSNNTGGTGAGSTISFNFIDDFSAASGSSHFNVAGAVSTAVLQAGVTTIQTTTAFHDQSLQVGDRACFIDSSGVMQIRRVTAISYPHTATASITIDGAAVSVAANTVISNGLFHKIYRTEEYGTIYYEVAKLPNDALSGGTGTYVDTVLDANLGDPYVEIEAGEEHDLPPALSYLCEHQGKLVGVGSVNNPNSVFWTGIDGEFFWPAAYNNTDVPSSLVGPITAIGSDDENSLAVFKKYGYYSIEGDLQARSIVVRKVKEGDYGISSHNSLVRINGVLVGVGPRGVIAVKGGQLDWEGFIGISPAIRNNSDIDLDRAVGFNDYTRSQYLLYVPPTDISTNPEDRLVLAYNYESRKWASWDTSSSMDGCLGFMVWEGRVFACSRRSVGGSSTQSSYSSFYTAHENGGALIELYEPQSNLSISGDYYAYSLVDMGFAVSTRIFTSFECLKDPSLDKIINYIRLWKVPPSFVQAGVIVDSQATPISQVLTVTVYKNWNTGVSTSTPMREFTFDTSELPFDDLVLDDESAKSIAIEILHSEKTKPMYLTGFEIGYALNNGVDSRRNQ